MPWVGGDTGRMGADGDDSVLRETEQEALVNLRIVLELCAAGQIRCGERTGRPSSATIRVLGEHLRDGDFYPHVPIASYAWPLLLQAGGLAKLGGARLELTPKGRAALRGSAPEVVRGLWQRWLTHAPIDELSRIENIKGQRSTNTLSAVKPRRQLVAQALTRCCSVGEWVEIDTLFAKMQRGNMSPTIARNDRALWKLYLEDPQYGSLGYDGFHDWSLLEGRYTLAVIFEYAGTLGLVDLDYVDPAGARDDYRNNWGGDDLDALSRYDGLLAVRLNTLGAYAVGLTDTYVAPVGIAAGPSVLKVLPNLDIVATGDLSSTDRLLMSAYATQTADYTWTVSAKTLLTAVGVGRDLAEFVDFLAAHIDHDLPGTVTTLLQDVRRRAAQLTDLGYLRIIECQDPALAAIIAGDRWLRTICRRIGDRHLAVAAEHEAKFRATLISLGYVLTPGILKSTHSPL